MDQILHDTETLRDFKETLQDYPMVFVGVHCSKEELIRREKFRGDRQSGLSASQLLFVHQQQENYDIEVDTGKDSLMTCVDKILKAIKPK